jgi:hypothetical protein
VALLKALVAKVLDDGHEAFEVLNSVAQPGRGSIAREHTLRTHSDLEVVGDLLANLFDVNARKCALAPRLCQTGPVLQALPHAQLDLQVLCNFVKRFKGLRRAHDGEKALEHARK